MQEDNTKQERVRMTAPDSQKRNDVYRNTSYSNAKKELELEDAAHLFNIIKRYLKRPNNNWKNPLSNNFYDKDYVLECTIANVKFSLITDKYSKRTYLKHFKHLYDIKAIRKVNPTNQKCHKYYVNPLFYHRLQSYNNERDSTCQIYHDNFLYLWDD